MVEIEMVCPFCGKWHSVIVKESAWFAYQEGALAQDAFSDLGVTEREQIISSICPECQDSIFGESE